MQRVKGEIIVTSVVISGLVVNGSGATWTTEEDSDVKKVDKDYGLSKSEANMAW